MKSSVIISKFPLLVCLLFGCKYTETQLVHKQGSHFYRLYNLRSEWDGCNVFRVFFFFIKKIHKDTEKKHSLTCT